jgi:Arc/MetJ family transcription regulator
MRTNIDIDDRLMTAAMAAGGFKTKREAVEESLRLIARRANYQAIRALRGQLHWDDSDAPTPVWEPAVPVAAPRTNRANHTARTSAKAKAR